MKQRNVLVVGSGGREHALVWKIAQSPLVRKVFCAPGNVGIARDAKCFPVKADDIDGLLQLVREKDIDFTVVGPELPLTLGIVDRFKAEGQPIFGPTKAAARIEGSKVFMKEILAKYNIPTADFKRFTDARSARNYVTQAPIVIKASGLAAGKGAIVCHTVAEAHDAIDRCLVKREFGAAGDEVVVEEFLHGEEASFLALVDGKNILPLAGSQDHKAVGDGDSGPNTGGMGAYSPAPVLTEEMYQKAMDQVIRPTVEAMNAEGAPYRGVLYAGLMIKDGEIKVLEFNVRFGDPEAQPVLMRMQSDLFPLLLASATGSLEAARVVWDPRAALCVVMASGGYPGEYETGHVISGLNRAAEVPDSMVFHAGTRARGGDIINAGGRVLGVTALGDTVTQAAVRAYEAVDHIHWQSCYYRRDIGYRAAAREKGEI